MRFIVSDRATGRIVKEIRVRNWPDALANHDEAQHRLHALPQGSGYLEHGRLKVANDSLVARPHDIPELERPTPPHGRGTPLAPIDPPTVRAWLAAQAKPQR